MNKNDEKEKSKKLNFIKDFLGWFRIKPVMDKKSFDPPLIKENEVWWCRLGENVGVEISGKGKEFARPAIIYHKFSRFSYLVVPTTTQLYNSKGEEKAGSWYFKFTHKKAQMLACLNQIRVIDYRRIKNKMGDLDDRDKIDLSKAFDYLYKK